MTTMAPPTESNSGDSEEFPSWAIPPQEGFTAEDLDRIPQFPPHTELIDGSLIVVSPKARFHMLVIRLLDRVLSSLAPDNLEIAWNMTITLTDRQRLEPDIMVVRRGAGESLEQTTYRPEDVTLVIEVVSPESCVRDRERKPQIYAESGISYMWRVENTDGEQIVYTFELEPASRRYAPTGVHHNRVRTSVPFDIDVDLTRIHQM